MDFTKVSDNVFEEVMLAVESVFQWVIPSRVQPWESDWNDAYIYTSVLSNPRRNRNLESCRSVLDRSCGFILLCRCAKEFLDESTYAVFLLAYRIYQKNECVCNPWDK